MTTECRRVEGLLAASMYEPLTAGERESLDAHLDECAVCRETMRGFQSLVREVPAHQPDLGTDLLPSIRARIGNEAPGRTVIVRRYVASLVAAAAVVLVAFGVGYAAMNAGTAPVAVEREAHAMRGSQLNRTFLQAERLMDARFHSRAFRVLDAAAKSNPNDARAPEALQLAADLAFDELHWYAEAHTVLRTLRDRYAGQFESTDANRIALEMLEEARAADNDYLALRLLDDARANGDFDSYERVLTQYPGTYIAARALDDMTAALAHEGDTVVALETLAETCTHPVAVAQVKIKLARTLDQTPTNRPRIRALYEEAATSESLALATTAREALQQIDQR